MNDRALALGVLAACAISIASGCAERQTPPVVFFSASYAETVQRVVPLIAALGSIGGGDSDKCIDVLARAAKGPVDEFWAHRPDNVGYEICMAEVLAAESLKSGGGPKIPSVQVAKPSRRDVADVFNRLDLASFPSSLRPQFDIRNGPYTLAHLKAKEAVRTKQSENMLELDVGDDWKFQISVLAEGQFGQFEPAWLIDVSDEALQGTYYSYAVYIVPLTPAGPLTAMDVEPEWRRTRIPPLDIPPK